MEQFKQFILRHFEKILVSVILIAAFVGTYFIEEIFIVLNFYYLLQAIFLGVGWGFWPLSSPFLL